MEARPPRARATIALPLLAACWGAAPCAHADIFQWAYVDLEDLSLGKAPSIVPVPDGLDVDAGPGAALAGLDLTRAYLIGLDLRQASFANATLRNADMSGSNVSGADFSGAAIDGLTLSPLMTLAQVRSTASYLAGTLDRIDHPQIRLFAGQNLAHFDLAWAGFPWGDLRATDLTGAQLSHANLGSCNLTGANLSDADLSNAQLVGAACNQALFDGAIVRGADFARSSLGAAQLYSTLSHRSGDLSGISLSGLTVAGWGLDGCDLSHADLSNADARALRCAGARLFYTGAQGADLSNASFAGADLSEASLHASNLSGADFSGARLEWTQLGATGITAPQVESTMSYAEGCLLGVGLADANLAGIDLSGFSLRMCDFSRAALTDAKLAGADLTWANLAQAKLWRADLTNARLHDLGGETTVLTGAVLFGADARGQTMLNGLSASVINGSGRIPAGITLDAGRLWHVWDHTPDNDVPIAIVVQQAFEIRPGAQITVLVEDAEWASTVSFGLGISRATLAGTLHLDFAPTVDPRHLVGTVFRLFDWTRVTINGAFDQITSVPGAVWDTSVLYTRGEVVLTEFAGVAATCPGDIDGDGDTDVFDFGLLAPAFATSLSDAEFLPAADLNGDNAIDVFDFGLLAPDLGCGY